MSLKLSPKLKSHSRAHLTLKSVVPILLVVIATVTLASVHTLRTGGESGSGQQSNRLEIERVTLGPLGFEPAEISRPAGRFLLAVNDQSGQSDTSITLLRESRETLQTVNMRETSRKHEWRKVMNLGAGRYLIRDNQHPEWTCSIVLTAN